MSGRGGIQNLGLCDGEKLISGSITQIIDCGSRWLIKTREQDCLVVVNFSRGGRQALLHLIDLFDSARLAQSRRCLH